jgi:hypothetical protein
MVEYTFQIANQNLVSHISRSVFDIQNFCELKCSASHSPVAPENVGLQKEQKYNTFACHTCNDVRLCVLGIRKKEVGNTKR